LGGYRFGIPKPKICAELSKLLPYDPTHIRRLLPTEYKQMQKSRTVAGVVSQNNDIAKKIETATKELFQADQRYKNNPDAQNNMVIQFNTKEICGKNSRT